MFHDCSRSSDNCLRTATVFNKTLFCINEQGISTRILISSARKLVGVIFVVIYFINMTQQKHSDFKIIRTKETSPFRSDLENRNFANMINDASYPTPTDRGHREHSCNGFNSMIRNFPNASPDLTRRKLIFVKRFGERRSHKFESL